MGYPGISWVITTPLIPIAPGWLNTVEQGNKMNESPKNKTVDITGIIFTVIITVGFIWAVYRLVGLSEDDVPITAARMQANEARAFAGLKMMAEAQEKYIQTDWDRDGKRVYAGFFVHLWTSVSPGGEPIPVNLIPRKQAFAMEDTLTVDGYYYVDLRKRQSEGNTRREIDHEKEWAMAAVPGSAGRTGVLTFIVDQSNVIYVTPRLYSQPEYPYRPERSGWTRIDTGAGLKEFQKSVNYPLSR